MRNRETEQVAVLDYGSSFPLLSWLTYVSLFFVDFFTFEYAEFVSHLLEFTRNIVIWVPPNSFIDCSKYGISCK